MLNLTRRLVALRRQHPVLKTGMMRMQDSGPLLQYLREADDEALMCVFNLGHSAVEWAMPSGWRIIESVNVVPGETAVLPPLAGLLLERDSA
jgi:alpha-glucosidase